MSKSLYLKSSKIVLKDQVISGVIEIKDQNIYKIHDYSFKKDGIVDYKDNIIAPGLIDIHTHGYKGYSFSGVSSSSDIEKVSEIYLQHGITSLVATVSPKGIKPVVKQIEKGFKASEILGLHLEGPFINPKRFGAANPKSTFLKPSLEILDNLLKDAKGYLTMMTLAPEVKNNDKIIERLIKRKVKVAVGHSNISYQEINEIEDKVDIITHLANAMSGLHHRQMGLLGYGLNKDIFVELIADGLHVEKPMLEIIFKIKSFDEIILISDSIALAGCKKGEYQLSDSKLWVSNDGLILNEFKHISGSSFNLLEIVKYLYNNYNFKLNDLFKMASFNPSKFLKNQKIGSIANNKQADLIVLNKDLDLIDVYKKGRLSFKQEDKKIKENPNLEKIIKDKEFLNFYGTK